MKLISINFFHIFIPMLLLHLSIIMLFWIFFYLQMWFKAVKPITMERNNWTIINRNSENLEYRETCEGLTYAQTQARTHAQHTICFIQKSSGYSFFSLHILCVFIVDNLLLSQRFVLFVDDFFFLFSHFTVFVYVCLILLSLLRSYYIRMCFCDCICVWCVK